MAGRIVLLGLLLGSGASGRSASPTSLWCDSVGATGVLLRWRPDVAGSPEGCYAVYAVSYQKASASPVRRESCGATTTYELLGLEPNTQYKVWVESNGWTSNPITLHTEAEQPGSPVLVNATCFATGQIRVLWTRPLRVRADVHSYKIYYKDASEATYKSVTYAVNASLQNETHFIHVLANLTTASVYSVKICAQSFSGRPGNKSAMSEPSREVNVYLPERACQKDPDGTAEMTDVTTVTAGIVVGAAAALFIVLLALACFLDKRFRIGHRRASARKSEARPTRGERIYDFGKKFGPDFLSESIHVDDFSAHVAKLHSDGDIGFANEYEDIQSFCKKNIAAKHESSALKENKPKNRYLNIVAFDHSRVPLRQESWFRRVPGYINANYIDSFQRCKSYIATQGPMENTMKDFWRMIWEQNVRVVVMITNLLERGRKKCDQYWPSSGSKTFGKIEVTLMKETELSNYTIRCIQITNLDVKVGENVRQLQQFHYTTWSDHGIPEHPLPVLSFVRKSVNANPADGGPIVIHCSAGVGRTGTFIIIDSMLQQVELMKSVNVSGFLKYVRTQRHHLVQTEDQYLFCHDIILEAIGCGRTEIHSSHFKDYVSKLEMPFWQDNNELNEERIIDKQFKLVTDYVPAECQHATAKKAEHISRNRDPNLMAIENYKVNFQRKSSELQLKYFNASWLCGHFKLREFILCQLPLSSELDLFWQMIYDTASQTIAMLSDINDKDCLQFWPDQNDEMSFEALIVRKVDETNENGIRILNFIVSCGQRTSDDLSVSMIVNPGWPHVSKDISRVFETIHVTNEQKLKSSNGCNGPLVVIDKFGGTEGATFCALLTLCNQLKSFNSVDVYLTTKLVHHRRPGVWKSPDDLLFIYKCLLAKITMEQSSSQVKLTENDEVLPTSLSNSNGPHWSQSRLTKKSSSGFGLSSSGTSTTNTTEDDVAQNRRFSFPPNFLTSSCDQGEDIIKKDEVEIDDEHSALKSPLLKANSYDV